MSRLSIAEAMHYLVDFVQGVKFSELKSGEDVASLERIDGELISRAGDEKALSELFDLVRGYLQGHAAGKKEISKRTAQTLSLVLAAIAKFDFYAEQAGETGLGQLAQSESFKKLRALALECESDRINSPREFLDHLEIVKEDLHYELFLMQKENGGRFFTSRLAAELHDAIDLDLLEEGDSLLAPVLNFKEMNDNDLQYIAETTMQRAKEEINTFLRIDYGSGRLAQMALYLRKAVMALVLCARKKNALLNVPVKASSYYFKDVIFFLRKAVSDEIFSKTVKKAESPEERALVIFAEALCFHFNMREANDHSSFTIVSDLVERGRLRQKAKFEEKKEGLITDLEEEMKAFNIELDHYVHGPLIRAWDFLSDESERDPIFDPWLHSSLPSRLGTFDVKGHKTAFIRAPSPTMQAYIHRAVVTVEYMNFLRYDPYQVHLVINLQGKERKGDKARQEALEQLSKEFEGQLEVLTTPKNCDLYDVIKTYASEDGRYSKAGAVIEACIKIFGAKGPGSLPSKIKTERIAEAFHLAHTCFLEGKKSLTVNERRLLIDTGYVLVVLHVLGALRPTSCTIICKDGIDKTGGLCGLITYLMHALGKGPSHHKLHALLRRLIFEVPMIGRERTLAQPDYERLINACRLVDTLSAKGKKELLAFLGEISLAL